MSEELFAHLGAGRVDWGEPDADGLYTPTVHKDPRVQELEEALRDLLNGKRGSVTRAKEVLY